MWVPNPGVAKFRMKRLLFSLLMALVAGQVSATTDTTKVFFIGNSFTYTYDVPGMVKGFADSAHLPMQYAEHDPGGISVGDISQDTLAHWRNAQVFNTLRLGGLNYVVLQDNQGRFVYNGYGSFPSPSTSRVVEGHIKIRDSMKHYSPCANMVLFAGWGPKGGYLPYAGTGAGLIRNIYGNYHFLNDSMKEILSPIGIAWNTFTAADTITDLWGPDATHQSAEGSYLTAAVLYTSMFKTSPVHNTFTSTIDTAVARHMRQIAWAVVMDSAHSNHLDSLSLPVIRIGNTLVVSAAYTGLQWYRNDTLLPGATSLTQLMSPGNNCYSVEGYTISGCYRRSLPYCGNYTMTVADEARAGEELVYPNPSGGKLYIWHQQGVQKVTVRDCTGRMLLCSEVAEGQPMDIQGLAPGLYLVSVGGGLPVRLVVE